MSTPATPTENWPKSWLLKIHQAAVEHGFVFIEPISEANALSLKQRLYRIRRRSDKANAAFIPPEYHMVGVGAWIEYPDERAPMGQLPIIYNRLPSGEPLPDINPVSEETFLATTAPKLAAQPLMAQPLAGTGDTTISKPIPIRPEDLTMDESQVDSYVNQMLANIKRGKADE